MLCRQVLGRLTWQFASKDGDEKGKMLERAANGRKSGVVMRVVTHARRHLFPDAWGDDVEYFGDPVDRRYCTVHLEDISVSFG